MSAAAAHGRWIACGLCGQAGPPTPCPRCPIPLCDDCDELAEELGCPAHMTDPVQRAVVREKLLEQAKRW